MAKKQAESNTAVIEKPAEQSSVAVVDPAVAALAELENSQMSVCRPNCRALAVAEANGEDVSFGMLTRVKTPAGGGKIWEYEDQGNPISTTELCGALVVWHKRAVLWPTEGDAVEGTQPILISNDLRRAFHPPGFAGEWGDIDQDLVEAARIPGTEMFDMERLQYNQWGTGKGRGNERGDGKRMKEQRIAGILPPDSIYPLIININPGSLKSVIPVVAKFTNFHYQTLVAFYLTPEKSSAGQAYSRINMRVTGELGDTEGAIIKRHFTEKLHAAIKESRVQVDPAG